ncbi:MAG: hypothetical protein PUI48_09015 [Oscillospiraceae bacterium]|nr:hypothetical protein [Oscillospiraceae bacterium]MDY6207364.1 hypothetical protein [Oscillospiraceae bacterium]
MDIKAKIEEIVTKIKADPDFLKEFQADPVKAVEKITGTDLPDDVLNPIIDGVKAKITADNVKGMLGGIFGAKK